MLFAGALSLGAIFMASSVMQERRKQAKVEQQKESTKSKTTYSGKADIGGPWKLYNTKGELVTEKNFAGKYYLIYFGFTFCPDVCPISL